MTLNAYNKGYSGAQVSLIQHENTAAGAEIELESIQASYTMGAMTVRGTFSESKDTAGQTGDNDEHMELSLVLAF